MCLLLLLLLEGKKTLSSSQGSVVVLGSVAEGGNGPASQFEVMALAVAAAV